MNIADLRPLHAFEVRVYQEIQAGWLDLSVTNTVLWMWVAILLSTTLLALALRQPQIVPGKAQMFVELYYQFIRRVTVSNIHMHGERFVPLMFTLFTFILGCNLIGLIPGSFTPTAQIIVTGTLAVAMFLYTVVLRFSLYGLGFFHAFVPKGIPGFLLPLMVPIELLSFMARPVSLAVRLFANMTAGHTVLGVIAFFGLFAPWFVQWVPMSLSVVLLAVELFIAVIQAYIFTVLSCVYIDDALHPHA